MAITCPGCSATISDQARFCPACGRQIHEEENASPPEASKREWAWGAAVVLIIGFVVVMALLLRYGSDQAERVAGAPAASSANQPAIAEPGVAAYIREIMAKPEVSKFIDARQWEGSWIVEVQVKGALSDPEIEGIVRSITTGVHNHSSNGNAQVQAFVGGIKVAVGDYSNWNGSIRVKMLR
jgi:hypothetical protein